MEPIRPGDSLKTCELKGLTGGATELGEGSYIGQTLVLWVTEGLAELGDALAFGGASEKFEAAGAIPHIILSGDPGPIERLPQSIAQIALLDPMRFIPRVLGVNGSGLAILDPESRLVAMLPTAEWISALERCQEILERTTETTVTAQAPVLVIRQVFEPELCGKLIAYWHASTDKMANRVSSSKRGSNVLSYQQSKVRTDVVVEDSELLAALVRRLQWRVFLKMYKAFGFKAAKHEALRIGCYDSKEGGHFRRHRDNLFGRPNPRNLSIAYRQFACTFNLNTEFEGGELWFPEYGRQRYKPDAGGAVVFSASLLHEALPVTAGRRFGLFTFLWDTANNKLRAQAREMERQAQKEPRPVQAPAA